MYVEILPPVRDEHEYLHFMLHFMCFVVVNHFTHTFSFTSCLKVIPCFICISFFFPKIDEKGQKKDYLIMSSFMSM